MDSRILIIDDHPVVREALAVTICADDPGYQVVGVATLAEGIARLADSVFDVVLLDLSLPDCEGPMSLARLRSSFPEVRVAVVSGTTTSDVILHCMSLGAAGYIPKTSISSVVVDALRLIVRGGRYIPPEALAGGSAPAPNVSMEPPAPLVSGGTDIYRSADNELGMTDRQMQVLRLVLAGLSNKHICRQLKLAEGTVKVHVSAVLRVLGVRSRTQAVIAASRLGLLAADRLETRNGAVLSERKSVKSPDATGQYAIDLA